MLCRLGCMPASPVFGGGACGRCMRRAGLGLGLGRASPVGAPRQAKPPKLFCTVMMLQESSSAGERLLLPSKPAQRALEGRDY